MTNMVRARKRLRRLGWALIVCATLAGCETDLYTKQTEADANEMLGALLDARLTASKQSLDGGKTWNVMVEKSQIAQAVALLKAAGLPQQRYASLGDLFKKDGLISTPTEERVRFIYGVSQELGHSLAQIDGVLVARVHVVLPNNDPLAIRVEPASASVFIKHRASINTTTLVPMIKNFVIRGVQGLTHENVSVTLIQAGEPVVEPASASGMTPAKPSEHAKNNPRVPAWAIALACLVLGLLALAGLARTWRAKPAPETSPTVSATAMTTARVTARARLALSATSAFARMRAVFKRRAA